MLSRFTQVATDGNRPLAARVIAAEWLAMSNNPSAGKLVVQLIDANTPPELARPAIRGLAKNIEGHWKTLADKSELLARLQPWTANDVTRKDALRLASALGTRALKEVTADEASQLAAPNDRLDPSNLPPAAELLAMPGDAGRGRNVFFRTTAGCAKCHSVGGQGAKTTALGPALDGIGKKMGRDGLLDSILRPEAKIAPQWLMWSVITTDGKTYAGLVTEETPERLVLTDGAGRRTAMAKADIDEKNQSNQSIMPQQLVGSLTSQDLADLLQFLVER